MNRLYFGDCLAIMQDMPREHVDLIYLDPPFNSNRTYNTIYTDSTGRPLPDQVEAFSDRWTLNKHSEATARTIPMMMRTYGIEEVYAEFWSLWVKALRKTRPCLLAYLIYMVERLLVMRLILRPHGTIYLHCDPTASHYLKIMMDALFGYDRFGNEIIWHYRRWPCGKKHFQRMHDVILRYYVGKNTTFNLLFQPYSPKTIHRHMSVDGKTVLSATRDRERGTKMDDVWDLPYLHSQSKERRGYPTQKPIALLKRIIEASSNEGDVVLDPFCGCGTTLCAAHELGRKWIGIESALHTIRRVVQTRLADEYALVEGHHYEILGIPRSIEGAERLWQRDPYHFQRWAVEAVDGFVTNKQTLERGIDGRVYFSIGHGQDDLQSMIIDVKGGERLSSTMLRTLRGILEREGAVMAGLVLLQEPRNRLKRTIQQEVAAAGSLDVYGVLYPRMQVLTVAAILAGQRFHTPSVVASAGKQGAFPLLAEVTAR